MKKCRSGIKSSKIHGRGLGKDVETMQRKHNYRRKRKHWKFLGGNAK